MSNKSMVGALGGSSLTLFKIGVDDLKVGKQNKIKTAEITDSTFPNNHSTLTVCH